MKIFLAYLIIALGTSAILPPVASDLNYSEIRYLDDHRVEQSYNLPLPSSYIDAADIPASFNWANIDGKSYITASLNQHLPQYCGSCWAHGSLSALADRIKIANNASSQDINLSIQFVLNCGSKVAGSCKGGSATGTYEFIHKKIGYIPYDTCQSYTACSSDMVSSSSSNTSHLCDYVNTTCSPLNICRTCESFSAMFNLQCSPITKFPNASIAEYGTITSGRVQDIQAEILVRGPVAAEVNGRPLHDYRGGIFTNETADRRPTHIVSIIGWGVMKQADYLSSSSKTIKYWIVRNSWGQYWGEMGFFRIEMGKNLLGIETKIIWATPGTFSEYNYPCFEDGKNCDLKGRVYLDPSHNIQEVQQRLRLLAANVFAL